MYFERKECSGKNKYIIEKVKPYFKKRHVKSHAPDCLFYQDIFYVGKLKEVGKIYVQIVVGPIAALSLGVCMRESLLIPSPFFTGPNDLFLFSRNIV